MLKNFPPGSQQVFLKGGNPPLFFPPPRSKDPPRNKHTRMGNVFLEVSVEANIPTTIFKKHENDPTRNPSPIKGRTGQQKHHSKAPYTEADQMPAPETPMHGSDRSHRSNRKMEGAWLRDTASWRTGSPGLARTIRSI